MAQTEAQRSAAARREAATRPGDGSSFSARAARGATGGSLAGAPRAVGSTTKNAGGPVAQRASAGGSESKSTPKAKKR